MKKLFLSVAVLGLFFLYGFHERNESEEVTVTPPAATLTAQTMSVQEATPTPQPSVQNSFVATGQYRDGTYTGSVEDAFYGNIQVQAIIIGGKITDVVFLQYPNDRKTSVEINQQAMGYLKQEAIQSQNAQVNIVSGATDSSIAFRKSLQSALQQSNS